MASDQRTGSVESLAAKAVVGLPTMWRIVTVIGSLASTIILLLGSFAFNMMREEWKELRAEVIHSFPTRRSSDHRKSVV